MPKLAVVCSHPIQYYGPLFRELARRADVTVFFAHRATPIDQANAGFGTPFDWDVELLSEYRHVFLTNVASKPSLNHFSGCDTPEIGARLAQGAFDVVLVMGWHLKSYVQAIWAAKRLHLPVLVRGDSQLETPRSDLKRFAKSLAYPALLRLFDAALYVGQRSRDYYIHYAYPVRRLFYSPHCVDTARYSAGATVRARDELRRELQIASDSRVLLFVGKLVSYKRPMDVIEAAAACRNNGLDFEVIIAGDGELRNLMAERGVELHVPTHLLGFCNQSKMPAVYAASDVLVLPSEHETWGLVANEALASGRPVILSEACGSVPDLAADRQVGRVFPVGNVASLAIAASETIARPSNPEVIRELSQRHSLAAAADGVMAAIAFVTTGWR
jgi:glycosyltransferase involved in cell wall biosynthesis